jgi:hypothetical protein
VCRCRQPPWVRPRRQVVDPPGVYRVLGGAQLGVRRGRTGEERNR